ncbi:MAG: hypothetical protein H0U63_04660 [Burkholderiales bacterium]|nr:hypothetical protein [Burkholderiales bacterium]
MAGSIAFSLTQRYDNTTHEPLDAGRLYTYAAGTTTPQSAYQDISLTIPWPNPITLDSGGNIPQLFFADGYIKIRLANADGVTQIAADYVLVLGPTTGGGAAPSVDATTIYQTGDLKPRYGTGAHTGWVRANGRTIGSATSGATESAASGNQSLFEHLWGADANLTVSTGRGASANADWVANKTIALPDFRGRVIAGLDDMGNSAAGRLSATYFGAVATTLGNAGGIEGALLAANQIPSLTSVNATQAISVTSTSVDIARSGSSQPSTGGPAAAIGSSGNVTSTGNNSISVAYTNAGQVGSKAVQPTMLATIYLKL